MPKGLIVVVKLIGIISAIVAAGGSGLNVGAVGAIDDSGSRRIGIRAGTSGGATCLGSLTAVKVAGSAAVVWVLSGAVKLGLKVDEATVAVLGLRIEGMAVAAPFRRLRTAFMASCSTEAQYWLVCLQSSSGIVVGKNGSASGFKG